MMPRPRLWLFGPALLLASCGGDQPDPNMARLSRVRAVRPRAAAFGWVPGTIPRPAAEHEHPTPREAFARAQENFIVYCAPCHGRDGRGDGIIVKHGFPPPPSLLEGRLRAAPDEHLLHVLENGLGVMPSYADLVPSAERPGVIAYIRALQRAAEQPADAGGAAP
jgi:mono/diheme cytochrome c family protein